VGRHKRGNGTFFILIHIYFYAQEPRANLRGYLVVYNKTRLSRALAAGRAFSHK